MRSIRQSIKDQRFPEFVRSYMNKAYPSGKFPHWILKSLRTVNIDLSSDSKS